MSSSILVGYATRYYSTQEVAEAVATRLGDHGFQVDLRPLGEVKSLSGYRAVVIGAPLYMFRWHKDALTFLKQRRQELRERPVAVFALGPTHDPHDDQEWQDSWAQLKKALAQFPWLTPAALEMFGGKFDPAKLRFPINKLAGNEPATDIRDWPAINAWASSVAVKFDSELSQQNHVV